MRPVKSVLAIVICLGIIFSSTPNVHADETSELLLKLLVKKGVITEKEANELRTEVSKIKEKEKIVVAEDVTKHVKKSSWAERIKFKGDIRLRNEYKRPGSSSYVNRQRIRTRVGLDADITDTVKGNVTLATRGDARSTNETLMDAFNPIDFDLDMAYIQWKPVKQMKLIGGKYEIPLYHPGDLLWDSDLRFEGASAHFAYSIREDLGVDIPLDLMLNTGVFPLDDLSIDKKNPYLYAIQGGVGSSFDNLLDWKGYFGYLDFLHIKGTRSTDFTPATGRADAYGFYYYDYNIIELSGEVTSHFLEQLAPKPVNVPITLFGDYIQNLADGAKRHGWELGVKFGEKPKKFGDWRAIYNFRHLERNSFPDEFPDADAFRGRTDGYGHEIILSYGLWNNIWLEFDYYLYRDKTLGSDPNDKWSSIFQTDINVKF